MVVTPDMDAALRRMDKYELDMRNKRLKRAADLSVKHTYLPYELQETHDPWADSSTSPAAVLSRASAVADRYTGALELQSRRCLRR